MDSFNIDYKEVDGANQINKELRNELFTISGKRGVYPQVFLSDKGESTEFIGDFEAIQSMVEDNQIDGSVLAANPDIKTFNTVFAGAKK